MTRDNVIPFRRPASDQELDAYRRTACYRSPRLRNAMLARARHSIPGNGTSRGILISFPSRGEKSAESTPAKHSEE